MRELTGKTAVVTGAGSGIGRALAVRLAAEGMTVVAADVEVPRLEETVATITANGGRGVAVPTDVTDADAVERLAERAFTQHDGVHLLCNNAGVFSGGLLWERSVHDLDWVLAVNVYGIFHAIRCFVPRMLEQGAQAHIVNTASMGGLVTNAYSGPYYASKFAAVGLTECLAHDLASIGAPIGVSLLVPSLVATAIGTSERNRHERFVERGNPEPSADAAFVARMLQDSTAGGMPPEEVSGLVVDAVRAGRFYIPTKPSYHEQISQRHSDMQELRLPRAPAID